MSNSAPQSDNHIDPVHSEAIQKEIGERLAINLNRKPVGMPPRLLSLMKRFRESIRVSTRFTRR